MKNQREIKSVNQYPQRRRKYSRRYHRNSYQCAASATKYEKAIPKPKSESKQWNSVDPSDQREYSSGVKTNLVLRGENWGGGAVKAIQQLVHPPHHRVNLSRTREWIDHEVTCDSRSRWDRSSIRKIAHRGKHSASAVSPVLFGARTGEMREWISLPWELKSWSWSELRFPSRPMVWGESEASRQTLGTAISDADGKRSFDESYRLIHNLIFS